MMSESEAGPFVEVVTTPGAWAARGGLRLKVDTPIGVWAEGFRPSATAEWTIKTPTGEWAYLPPTYSDDHVRSYLRVLIKSAVQRLLAAVTVELPDRRPA